MTPEQSELLSLGIWNMLYLMRASTQFVFKFGHLAVTLFVHFFNMGVSQVNCASIPSVCVYLEL